MVFKIQAYIPLMTYPKDAKAFEQAHSQNAWQAGQFTNLHMQP